LRNLDAGLIAAASYESTWTAIAGLEPTMKGPNVAKTKKNAAEPEPRVAFVAIDLLASVNIWRRSWRSGLPPGRVETVLY